MIRWVQLGVAEMPGGGGELRLMQRGHEFSIMAGPIELMNSRVGGSEEQLATLAHERIKGRAKARVLIGGLGMGFTLRAALKVFGADAKIDVSELVPEVVAWARGPLEGVFEGSLSDPRVGVLEEDVAAIIARSEGAYDAILLDVDNGPEGLTRDANDKIYNADGLGLARAALRPGGVLAVWSSGPYEPFTKRLRLAGFDAEEVRVRAHRGKGRHVIWLAVRR